MDEVGTACSWCEYVSTYPDLRLTQAAFMDDLLIWDGAAVKVQKRLDNIIAGFAGWGLPVNIPKCSLYTSPKHEGKNFIQIGGIVLHPQKEFVVMRVPFKVGSNVRELMQPTLQRAKSKFWALRHHFQSLAPTRARIRMIDRVIGGSALWCVSSFPSELGALQSVNRVLFLMCTLGSTSQKTG